MLSSQSCCKILRKVFTVDHYFCSYKEWRGGGSSVRMVPESFEQNSHKTCSAVASKDFRESISVLS